jgi:leucyl/phenylalanyl-tRNA--protein transferase
VVSNAYYQLPGGRVTALEGGDPFPAPELAIKQPEGLLAIGGDLSPERLLSAYRLGIFPWFSEGEPIMWWSPDPRMVLFPDELKISRSLSQKLRRPGHEVRFDSAFRAVMQACAAAQRHGQPGTWITDGIIEAYCRLHELGFAHSAETWIDGRLAGGLYGVAIGKMFYGESMFHHATDASKIAFVHWVRHLQQQGFGLIDCQMKTSHLGLFGAREISRAEFSQRLVDLVNCDGKDRIEVVLRA